MPRRRLPPSVGEWLPAGSWQPHAGPPALPFRCGYKDVRQPHKARHIRRSRAGVNLSGRADLLNLARAHDDDAVGDGEGFFLIVGNIDSRLSQRAENLAQFGQQLLA